MGFVLQPPASLILAWNVTRVSLNIFYYFEKQGKQLVTRPSQFENYVMDGVKDKGNLIQILDMFQMLFLDEF